MEVTTETGTYNSALDMLNKVEAFLNTNGFTVKDGTGDVAGGSAIQAFTATTWKAIYSDAALNPNDKWVSPGEERIHLLMGINTSFGGLDPNRLMFKCARWFDNSAGSVPGTSVVDHLNPADNTTGDLGIKDGANGPKYYLVTDGSPTVSGSYFALFTQEDPTSAKWKMNYCGLLQTSSRKTRSLAGSFTGNTIDLGVAPPPVWNPSLAGVSDIRLRIVNQTDTGPKVEYISVLSVSGTVLNLAGSLSGSYTNPIVSNDPQPVCVTHGLSVDDLLGGQFSAMVHSDLSIPEFGVIDIVKPAGLTIPLGKDDQFKSQAVYQLGLHNDNNANGEWMRGGLTGIYFANMTASDGDFVKLQGSNENLFQRFAILNLIGDNGTPNRKVIFPFENEIAGV